MVVYSKFLVLPFYLSEGFLFNEFPLYFKGGYFFKKL